MSYNINPFVKKILIITVIILVAIIIYWRFSKYIEKFDDCNNDKESLVSIDIEQGTLKTLYKNLNGVTYTWPNAPFKSIRLNNFNFDKNTVQVTINEEHPPICKTITSSNDSFIVRNAYDGKDYTFYYSNDQVHLKNNDGDFVLNMV